MRIISSTADLSYPYIQFTYIDYDKGYIQYNFMGCVNIESSKIYNMKLNLNEIKNLTNMKWKNILDSVDSSILVNNVKKIKIESETKSFACNKKLFII